MRVDAGAVPTQRVTSFPLYTPCTRLRARFLCFDSHIYCMYDVLPIQFTLYHLLLRLRDFPRAVPVGGRLLRLRECLRVVSLSLSSVGRVVCGSCRSRQSRVRSSTGYDVRGSSWLTDTIRVTGFFLFPSYIPPIFPLRSTHLFRTYETYHLVTGATKSVHQIILPFPSTKRQVGYDLFVKEKFEHLSSDDNQLAEDVDNGEEFPNDSEGRVKHSSSKLPVVAALQKKAGEGWSKLLNEEREEYNTRAEGEKNKEHTVGNVFA